MAMTLRVLRPFSGSSVGLLKFGSTMLLTGVSFAKT
jgi:hypothetical protein